MEEEEDDDEEQQQDYASEQEQDYAAEQEQDYGADDYDVGESEEAAGGVEPQPSELAELPDMR